MTSSPETSSSYPTPSSTPHLVGLAMSPTATAHAAHTYAAAASSSSSSSSSSSFLSTIAASYSPAAKSGAAPAVRTSSTSSASSASSSSTEAREKNTPDLLATGASRRAKGPHTTPQSSGFTSPETRSPAYVTAASPHSTPRWEPLDALPDVAVEGDASAEAVMLSDAADPKDLRQALLRRNVAALRQGREMTSGSELEEAEAEEDEPRPGGDSNSADPVLVNMLFVLLYPLFLLFFLLIGEVLPAAKEALSRAGRVFLLTAKAAPKQDRREKASNRDEGAEGRRKENHL
jgi:hypothetical protein